MGFLVDGTLDLESEEGLECSKFLEMVDVSAPTNTSHTGILVYNSTQFHYVESSNSV